MSAKVQLRTIVCKNLTISPPRITVQIRAYNLEYCPESRPFLKLFPLGKRDLRGSLAFSGGCQDLCGELNVCPWWACKHQDRFHDLARLEQVGWNGNELPSGGCGHTGPSLAALVTSPRQHFPEGFFTSQAQRPALTSALIRLATVDFPVLRISSQISWRVKPKQ